MDMAEFPRVHLPIQSLHSDDNHATGLTLAGATYFRMAGGGNMRHRSELFEWFIDP
jgi:hypothetical protein